MPALALLRAARRTALPVLIASLTACGGGSDSDSGTRLRLLNGSAYDSLDLLVDDDTEAESVAYGTASDYAGIDDESVELVLTKPDSSTELLNTTKTLSSDANNLLIAYGWQGHLKTLLVVEDEDEPDDDDITTLAVVNAAPDAGDLDIYLTGEDDALSDASAVQSAIEGGTRSSFADVDAGTYRLRVTAADDPSDIRLDVSGVTLPGDKAVNLVLTSGSSGVLVNAILAVEGGDVTSYANTQARLRVIGAVADNATVAASTDDTSLLAASRSPAIGQYKLVAAGDLSVALTVAGQSMDAYTETIVAGTDVTLLLNGDAETPTVTSMVDDNRLPTDDSTVKLRLLNAVSGLDSTLELALDYSTVASAVDYGNASDYGTVDATTTGELQVTSPLYTDALYALSDVTLTANSLYTVYMFGSADSPSGSLRKDR